MDLEDQLELEEQLEEAFELATEWNAILLIDGKFLTKPALHMLTYV